MKQDFMSVQNIYIICGKTDMRKGIDAQDAFKLDPYSDSIFLFSGTSKDRYKCLYFDGDGFAIRSPNCWAHVRRYWLKADSKTVKLASIIVINYII